MEDRRLFADFTVTTTSDSGPGSLREAINLANTDETADNILFNIPGSGVHTIQPLSPLPAIVTQVNINGYSQPGASPNSLAVGDNAVLQIELNGNLLPDDNSPGLLFADQSMGVVDGFPHSSSANGSSVRGLIVNGQFNGKIKVAPESIVVGITIAGNFIGTNAAGTAQMANPSLFALDGVTLTGFSAQGSLIGGATPADRNVISDTSSSVQITDRASNNIVQNNYVGLDATGTKALFNYNGIEIDDASNNLIGGTTPAERNVINGNTAVLLVNNSTTDTTTFYNRVTGNYMGTTPDGVTKPVDARMTVGVSARFGATNNLIGGNNANEGNVIAHASAGVVVDRETVHDPIRHNSIFNCERSIYLGVGSGDGGAIDVNDLNDTDTGGNNGQNFAAITDATLTATGTHVKAFLNTRPSQGYVVDFYSSPAGGNPLFGQARTFLGTVQVTTDSTGNATIDTDLPAVPVGSVLTNIVTSLSTFPFGDSSPVSPSLAVTGIVTPPPPVVPGLSVANVSTIEGNSGTKTLTFTVKLSAAAAGPVTVNYKTTDGTAKVGDNDYVAKTGTLSFAAGETSKTVSITIKGDTKVEGNESFNLLLSSAIGATLSDSAAVGSITNDDTPPPLPKLSVGGYTAKEGHSGTTAFTFKVTLDKSSSNPITVKYATADDSAKAGSDYSAASGTLTFAAGQTSKTVTVYVKGDKVKEAEEKFFLLLSAPTNATIAVGTGTGRIQNDD